MKEITPKIVHYSANADIFLWKWDKNENAIWDFDAFNQPLEQKKKKIHFRYYFTIIIYGIFWV